MAAFIGSGLSLPTTTTSKSVTSLTMTSDQPITAQTPINRRAVLQSLGALALLGFLPSTSIAADTEAAAPPTASETTLTPADLKFGLSGNYKEDTVAMVNNMKIVTGMSRGTPGMADAVADTRKMMNEYVALYRRNAKVNGSLSFNTIYTSINTLSGHYQSYGNTYPVPEKRRKRLGIQYAEIEKAVSRGR
eukprot:CAMPEP_0184691414 /NCGR_PEP_ID=MMETSP0313-20130426/280_1 /TAXON_ID=2792 /ORGANISM="Porphyridium aerugineum, Strain SAG 1380-2" /LENGTH=190 /DNA_ID=CAMNT_0027149125 /DNA_START=48 /DNA_END=620 /DNA_ORIENTATION=-